MKSSLLLISLSSELERPSKHTEAQQVLLCINFYQMVLQLLRVNYTDERESWVVLICGSLGNLHGPD